MSEWIKVADRLPLRYKLVLVCWRPIDHKERPYHKEVMTGIFSVDLDTPQVWANNRHYDVETHITHWMPLPEPP